jgi:hypothetical protein
MDSSLHSHLAAQLVQDRIAASVAPRQVREIERARQGEPRLRSLRRLLGHGARSPVAPAAEPTVVQ